MGGEFQAMILRLREGGIGGACSDGEMERSIIQVRTLCTVVGLAADEHAKAIQALDARLAKPKADQAADALTVTLTLSRCAGSWPTGRRAAARSGAAAW